MSPMNTFCYPRKLAAAALTVPVLLATSPAFAHDESTPVYLPESHAPAGVMSDHLHRKGEWMLGYRSMRSSFSGIRYGSRAASAEELASAGFSMMPTAMTMDMQMLDIMYAVSDSLTLMLMPQAMSMDMTMSATGGGAIHEDMGEMPSMTGMGTGEMPDNMATHGAHSHGTSGIGDTVIAGLFRLANASDYKLHGTLGISAPTGDVDLKNADGAFVHYGMQLGSGTWDLMPSITYTSGHERLSWGGQACARLPLQEENASGFRIGERFSATAWSAYRVASWISLSARLGYTRQQDISGHYNGPHNHSSPADLQANYGGEFLEAAVGANLVLQEGVLAGVRLGVEWSSDVSAHYNGYQLDRDDGFNLSLTYAY